MKTRYQKLLYWLPRLFSLIFLGLLCLVACDVFGTGYGFLMTVVAFFLHLLPALIMGAAIFIAWRWERAGGALFIVLGLVYYFSMSGTFFFKLPLTLLFIMIGVLFLLSRRYRE